MGQGGGERDYYILVGEGFRVYETWGEYYGEK